MMYAKVAVESANYSFDAEFDYIIPNELLPVAKIGCRVTVPFGSGNRKSLGIIFDITDFSEGKRLKKIFEVLDENPLLSEEMLGLARYISDRCFCTLYESAKAMLPPGINLKMVQSYAVNVDCNIEKANLLIGSVKEVYDYLQKKGIFVKEDKIFKDLALKPDKSILDMLIRKNFIVAQRDAVKNLGDLTTRMVRLAGEYDETKLTKKQLETAKVIGDVGSATVKEICYFTGGTPSVINALVKNGVAEFFECSVDYFAGFSNMEGVRSQIVLTEEQENAFNNLKNLAFSGQRNTSLLFGVTGSGKTSVYMRLMDEVIDSGKNVLLLVPEIGLTPQALSIFCKRYGKEVAVFHSALSVRERREQWLRVKRGEAKLTIGTRSAIFAPFENLGLIIIDEEQEHTYKSEQTPRYDATDIAKYRAAYHNCLLLLASATPRVESYASALSGKYNLYTLTERYGNAVMPDVITVDMRRAELMPKCNEISKELFETVKSVIDNGKQCILLINRRGYNTFAVCESCQSVITCPHCSISMTYHSANRRLMCHYCGYSMSFTEECPQCQERAIRYAGFGTQKIEDELQSLLPEAKILRMDADTTTAKDSHEKLLGAFERGEYNILIGTQMVAKGLNFPNVTLVGVISVDQQLYNDDFRSLEKTFSLLTQVVGRSGRGNDKGIALVQTLTPENDIIQIAAKQDYVKFFNTEIKIRKGMVYPPYCDLCVVGFIGAEEITVKAAANNVIDLLKSQTEEKYKYEKIIVLGPVPARVSKVSGKFRYRVIIKCRNTKSFRKMISEILKESEKDKRFKAISVYADMNPDSTL